MKISPALQASLFIVFLTITPLRSQTTDGKSDYFRCLYTFTNLYMIFIDIFSSKHEKGKYNEV